MAVQFQMTGKMGQQFLNNTPAGKVLNFYLFSGGYWSGGKFNSYRYSFEAWLEALFPKIQEIPKFAIVTVEFTLVPKTKTIGEVKINSYQLKVDNIKNWSADVRVGEANRGGVAEDDSQIEMELEMADLPVGKGNRSLFPEDTT